MRRLRPGAMATVEEVEGALDQALRELRSVGSASNTMAISSLEYRIGALRRRKSALEWMDRPRAASAN